MSGGLENNIDNVVPTEKKPAKVTKEEQKQTTPEVVTSGKDLLSWEGASFDFQEKNIWWYVIAGIFVAGLVGYFVWTQDWYLIAITVIVSAIMFWYAATARPQSQKYAITSFGLTIDGREYPTTEMHSFWIIYNEKVKKLYVTLTKKYLPSLILDLSDVDPNRVRIIMRRRIPEQIGQGENILDRLLRTLRI